MARVKKRVFFFNVIKGPKRGELQLVGGADGGLDASRQLLSVWPATQHNIIIGHQFNFTELHD